MVNPLIPRLTDMVEAIERVSGVIGNIPLEVFEADWEKRWLVERGIEILSEASRYVTEEIKSRHPEIPWPKVAGIGNVLRHNYEAVSAPVLWKLVRDDLASLGQVCREELAAARASER